MGAIEKSTDLVTVSQISRIMGQSRQATRRSFIRHVMVRDELVAWLDNPNHRKQNSLELTDKDESKPTIYSIRNKLCGQIKTEESTE